MVKCDKCGKEAEETGFPSIAMNVNGARINIGVAYEDWDDPDRLDAKDWCEECALKTLKNIVLYPLWTRGGE